MTWNIHLDRMKKRREQKKTLRRSGEKCIDLAWLKACDSLETDEVTEHEQCEERHYSVRLRAFYIYNIFTSSCPKNIMCVSLLRKNIHAIWESEIYMLHTYFGSFTLRLRSWRQLRIQREEKDISRFFFLLLVNSASL